jgi:hypothetical protein
MVDLEVTKATALMKIKIKVTDFELGILGF